MTTEQRFAEMSEEQLVELYSWLQDEEQRARRRILGGYDARSVQSLGVRMVADAITHEREAVEQYILALRGGEEVR